MLINQLNTDNLEMLVQHHFPAHPFEAGVDSKNVERVLSDYLAMSIAFPYLQAGAQHRLIMECIERDVDVTHDMEVTSVVGGFLAWDEAGGHAKILKGGNQALPSILDTKAFHANLLRDDLKVLFNRELKPSFSAITKEYLKRLEYGLSSVDPVVRVAYMVAFEKHAGRMIEALWDILEKLHETDKEKLKYFYIHVGGDDPAEEYHVKMTGRMIEETINPRDSLRFFDSFVDAYRLNYEWCEAIKH
jgi:hypothetical protein